MDGILPSEIAVAQDTAPSPRETRWRQGHLIAPALAGQIGLSVDHHHIVISHDCDLAAAYSVEPNVEVIRALQLPVADPLVLYGRNPRRLQISVSIAGEPCVIEFSPHEKLLLSKEDLYRTSPQGDAILSEKQLRSLQVWLAIRYRRAALPNKLVDRLKPVVKKLEEKAKSKQAGVIATWISYEPSDDIPDHDVYELRLAIVHDTSDPSGESNAQAIATAVEKAFDSAAGLALIEVEVLNEQEFTLADLRSMTELTYEHISFRDDGTQVFVEPTA